MNCFDMSVKMNFLDLSVKMNCLDVLVEELLNCLLSFVLGYPKEQHL